MSCSSSWHVRVELSNVSDGVVDAVEAAAEMAEHLTPRRSSCRCNIVYADFSADQRYHFTVPCGRGIRKIADIDWQQIHRRMPSNWAPIPADQRLQLACGRAGISVGVSDRNHGQPRGLLCGTTNVSGKPTSQRQIA